MEIPEKVIVADSVVNETHVSFTYLFYLNLKHSKINKEQTPISLIKSV